MKTLTLAAVLVAFSAASAEAQLKDPFGPSGASSGKIADVARSLSLTPKQRKRLRVIKDSLRKTEVKTRAAIQIVRIDLRSELDKAAPKRGKVGAYIDKISKLEAEARKAKVYASLEVRKLLDKKQWAQLQALHGHGHRHRHTHRMELRELKRELRKHKHDLRKRAREARHHAREAMRRARADARRARAEARRVAREAKREAKRAAKRKSTVRVVSSPSGASVYVDGRMVGRSPVVIRLRPGSHQIKVLKKGYKSKVSTVQVKPGQSMAIDLRLSK